GVAPERARLERDLRGAELALAVGGGRRVAGGGDARVDLDGDAGPVVAPGVSGGGGGGEGGAPVAVELAGGGPEGRGVDGAGDAADVERHREREAPGRPADGAGEAAGRAPAGEAPEAASVAEPGDGGAGVDRDLLPGVAPGIDAPATRHEHDVDAGQVGDGDAAERGGVVA